MNPQQFLDFAVTLAGTPDGSHLAPAHHRTAISRSYYAAFNAARQFLDKIGVQVVRDENVHLTVRQPFANCPNPMAREIDVTLLTLIKQRKPADYAMNDSEPESRKNAQLACEQSRTVFNKLSQCLQPGIFETVRDAIRSWVQSNGKSNLRAT